MRKRPEVVSATALIALAAALLSVSAVAVMLLAAGLSPGWRSQPAQASHNAGGTLNLLALDMNPASAPANTIDAPVADAEQATLGSIENCISVNHPAEFDIDVVVSGFPAGEPLVGYEVDVSYPAGLQVNNSITGDIPILARTLVSADPQSGGLSTLATDPPNYGLGAPLVGPNTWDGDVLDFSPLSVDEGIDGEETIDGHIVRLTMATNAAGPALHQMSLVSSAVTFLIDDGGVINLAGPDAQHLLDGTVAVDTSCQALPVADEKPDETTNEDTPVSITLTGSDEETCELTFATAGATNGTLGAIANNDCAPNSLNTDSATVTFTPDQDVCDPENGSFTYTVNDGLATSAAATVDIEITCVNDPPVASNVDMGEVLMDSLAGAWTPDVSDPDPGDTLTCSIVTQPAHGTVFVPATCSIGGYTPDDGFTGSDSFTYRVTDSAEAFDEATVTVEVVLVLSTPTPTPTPTAVAAATATPTAAAAVLPGTGDGISLGGGGSSGLTFLAIGLVLLVVAPGTVAVGVILRRKAKLGR